MFYVSYQLIVLMDIFDKYVSLIVSVLEFGSIRSRGYGFPGYLLKNGFGPLSLNTF